MTGNNQRQFIRSAGACHRPHRAGAANTLRDLAIAAGLPRRDLTQRLPDLKLKRRAAQIQRQGKRLPVVIKMGKYLRHPLTKNLVARMQPRIGEQAG